MRKYFKKLNYKNENVDLLLNEHNIMMLVTEDDYIARPTVYLDCKRGENEVFIKTSRENEGMLEWLLNNKIIKDVSGFVTNGYEDFPIGKIDLNEFKEVN